jgi:hypothetical protein
MTASLERRIEALEHPFGRICLCCALGKLAGLALDRCSHGAGNSLVDVVRAMSRSEPINVRYLDAN